MKDDIKTYLTSVGVEWEEVNDLAMVRGGTSVTPVLPCPAVCVVGSDLANGERPSCGGLKAGTEVAGLSGEWQIQRRLARILPSSGGRRHGCAVS